MSGFTYVHGPTTSTIVYDGASNAIVNNAYPSIMLNAIPSNSTLLTIEFNCDVLTLGPNVFSNCLGLATITFNCLAITIDPLTFAGTRWENTYGCLFPIDNKSNGLTKISFILK